MSTLIESGDLLDEFFEECSEHLHAIEQGLGALRDSAGDAELLHRIFRAAHTIKGNCAMFGLAAEAEFTHGVESLLDALREGKSDAASHADLLLASFDCLTGMLEAARGVGEAPTNSQDLLCKLKASVGDGSAAVAPATAPKAENAPVSSAEGSAVRPASDSVSSETESRANEAAHAKQEKPGEANESIRVAVAKLESLLNLAGELAIANSALKDLIDRAPPEVANSLADALSEVGRTTRVVQEHVFALRMVPIETGLRRFPRLIRYLSDSLGKPLNLVLTGGEVELDKRLVEQIVDPLTHLIRNAADHGIEMPDERTAAGKPIEGTVRLAVKQEGQNVVLTLTDDGKGLDVDRIRKKAFDRKLVRKDEELTESQALDLIFRPGFSTAEVVTDLSGRGVGLDVVRRNVDAMGGSIAVSSKRGQGCEFRITLPLTTAVLDGLAIEIGDAVAIAPLLSVVESLRPDQDKIRTMGGAHEMLLLRGQTAPMVRLDRIFELPAKNPDPTEGIAVVVEHDGRFAALTADRLAGQVQVVLKSLEANYRRIDGIGGAAILGDGRVAFVLDVPALVNRACRGT